MMILLMLINIIYIYIYTHTCIILYYDNIWCVEPGRRRLLETRRGTGERI